LDELNGAARSTYLEIKGFRVSPESSHTISDTLGNERDHNSMSQPEGRANHIVFFITTASIEEGERIARSLLEERLAACLNLVPAVRSFFWWEGKVQEEGEVLLIGKGRADLFPKVQALVRALHSYTVPEIIAIPITSGLPDYLSWINDSTSHSESR